MSSDFFDTTIGEQITLQRGFDITKKEQKIGNVPVVSSGGISSFHNKAMVSGPGVVLGRKGCLGTVFYLAEEFWPHDTSLWVKDFKENNPRFVYYFFKNLSKTLKKMDVGAANPALNRNHVHPLPAKWPKREIQDSIVSILSSLDDKIELNRQTNQTLEQIAQAIFKSWFVDFDPVKAKIEAKAAGRDPERAAMCAISGAVHGCTNVAGARTAGATKSEAEFNQLSAEQHKQLAATAALFPDELVESELGLIPVGWEVSTIGKEVEVVGGGTPSTKNPDFWENGIYHWTTPKDFSKLTDKILATTGRKISKAGLAKISSGLLPVDTVLMSSRAPVGYLALAKIPVAINQGYIAMKCNDRLPPTFVLQWANSVMDDIKQRASGTTFAEISKKNFRVISTVVPGTDLMFEYTQITESIYSKISESLSETKSLTEIRDTLLPKLLSGELRPPSIPPVKQGGSECSEQGGALGVLNQ